MRFEAKSPRTLGSLGKGVCGSLYFGNQCLQKRLSTGFGF